MICDLCQGKVYPPQCRNLAAFRHRYGAPGPCPHGIPLNNLPIGDNAPEGLSRPVAATTPMPCIHARPYRKCGGCALCALNEPILRVVKRAECQICVSREEHEAVHVH